MNSENKRSVRILRTAAVLAAVLVSSASALPSLAKPNKPGAPPKVVEKGSGSLETYQDLIQKAQNLTLQRDRLQTSQVLTRGIQRETRGSAGYRELVRALDELTSVFYTEKAQSLFATAEAQSETKPREAIDQFLEALRVEDGNVSILKSLARVYLRLNDCDRAENIVRAAENIDAYSPEIRLLRLQVLECQKNYELLALKLQNAHEQDLEQVEKFTKGIQLRVLVFDQSKRKDLKKAKAVLGLWEKEAPDYPELHFWKWEVSRQSGAPDRTSALKYSQLCQNLTPRKRKSFHLDVDLCKGKEAVDAYLRESGLQSPPNGASSRGDSSDD